MPHSYVMTFAPIGSSAVSPSQAAAAALQKSFGKEGKQLHAARDFGEIPLILRRSARPVADRIAKIIHGKPRHDRIKINDTDPLSGLIVEHDIV